MLRQSIYMLTPVTVNMNAVYLQAESPKLLPGVGSLVGVHTT